MRYIDILLCFIAINISIPELNEYMILHNVGTEARTTATPSTTSTPTAGTRAPPSGPAPGATTRTTSSQSGPIPANPFASLMSGTFGGIPGFGVSISQSTGAPPAGTPGQPQPPNILQMLQSMLQTGATAVSFPFVDSYTECY